VSRLREPADIPMSCPICISRQKAGTIEVFVISEGLDKYFFNVNKAKTIVTDNRPSIVIPTSTVRVIVSVNDYSPLHLPHVDPRKPGIVVQRFGGLVLLDGIHRAVRCLEEKATFRAFILNYQESLACLVRQEIASNDAQTIVAKLRKVLATAPGEDIVEAELECSQQILVQVRAMLTPEEKWRIVLRQVPSKRTDK